MLCDFQFLWSRFDLLMFPDLFKYFYWFSMEIFAIFVFGRSRFVCSSNFESFWTESCSCKYFVMFNFNFFQGGIPFPLLYLLCFPFMLDSVMLSWKYLIWLNYRSNHYFYNSFYYYYFFDYRFMGFIAFSLIECVFQKWEVYKLKMHYGILSGQGSKIS